MVGGWSESLTKSRTHWQDLELAWCVRLVYRPGPNRETVPGPEKSVKVTILYYRK